jgi:phosphatidylglycerophosphate synthase
MSEFWLYLYKFRDLGLRQRATLEAALWWVAIVVASVLALPKALTIWHLPGALTAFIMIFGLGIVLLLLLPRHYPHQHFGWCNAVTFIRAAAVCWLAGLWYQADSTLDGSIAWGVSLAGILVLALDGLDGWLARKLGNQSSFGARFDMEVDSLLALVLAVLVWQSGKVGVWVLMLGLFRPAFILAGSLSATLTAALPESGLRKAVCVIQVAALSIVLAPIVTPFVAQIMVGLTLALLLWSFGRDTLWLLRK